MNKCSNTPYASALCHTGEACLKALLGAHGCQTLSVSTPRPGSYRRPVAAQTAALPSTSTPDSFVSVHLSLHHPPVQALERRLSGRRAGTSHSESRRRPSRQSSSQSHPASPRGHPPKSPSVQVRPEPSLQHCYDLGARRRGARGVSSLSGQLSECSATHRCPSRTVLRDTVPMDLCNYVDASKAHLSCVLCTEQHHLTDSVHWVTGQQIGRGPTQQRHPRSHVPVSRQHCRTQQC